MNTLIASLSHRRESNSQRIAEFIGKQMASRQQAVEVFHHGKTPLPMWSETLIADDKDGIVKDLQERAAVADSFVFVIPEYSGMAAPAFKNFILLMSDEILGHKPSLIVGVSAGQGGAYPIAELRMSSYKNTRIVYIPENVLIRGADTFPEGKEQEETRKRLDYSLALLTEYAKAMQQVRNSPVLQTRPHPFGV